MQVCERRLFNQIASKETTRPNSVSFQVFDDISGSKDLWIADDQWKSKRGRLAPLRYVYKHEEFCVWIEEGAQVPIVIAPFLQHDIEPSKLGIAKCRLKFRHLQVIANLGEGVFVIPSLRKSAIPLMIESLPTSIALSWKAKTIAAP